MANISVESVIETKARTDGTFATAYAVLQLDKTINVWCEALSKQMYENMLGQKAIEKAIEGAGHSFGGSLAEYLAAMKEMGD